MPEQKRKPGIGGFLTRKVGPLPMWAWALIVAAGVFFLYRKYAGGGQAGSQAGSAGLATDGAQGATGTDLTSSGIDSNPGGSVTDGTTPLPDAGIAREIKDWIQQDLDAYLQGLQNNPPNITDGGTSGAPTNGGTTTTTPGGKKSGKKKPVKKKPAKGHPTTGKRPGRKLIGKPHVAKKKVIPSKTHPTAIQQRAQTRAAPRPAPKPHLPAKKKIVKGTKITGGSARRYPQ